MQRRDAGQAAVLVVGLLWALLLGALVLGGVARGIGSRADSQRAADLGALAGARAMRAVYARLFEPAVVAGRRNPARLTLAEYVARGRAAALATARRNGARDVVARVREGAAPVSIEVIVRDDFAIAGARLAGRARAVAEFVAAAGVSPGPGGAAGEYRGPFAHRQGRPMRPDVALAFDRLAVTARRDGVALVIASAFRSDAEQARLYAANPDPHWVARPGTSLHRLGTELDLGPPSAYRWLAANAPRFGFVKRYAWEPWHWGYSLNAASAAQGDGLASSALPAFVPSALAPVIGRAAMRWNVSAALLAAQLWQESRFDPRARSPAGALGIAQFMPATARAYGLRDPFDAAAAIEAQARLMRDLLRRFGAVALALAAYNAGPGRVAACGCVPPIPETVSYVNTILGILGGAGDSQFVTELIVRLVV